MEWVGIIVSAASLAGAVVWSAIHVGIKIGAMGEKLEAHATAVSAMDQQMGRLDGRLRIVERYVVPPKGG